MLVVPHFSPPMMIRFGIAAWRLRRRRRPLLRSARVALAGTCAHRLVGGVGGDRGGRVCVSVSDTSGLV